MFAFYKLLNFIGNIFKIYFVNFIYFRKKTFTCKKGDMLQIGMVIFYLKTKSKNSNFSLARS